MSKHWTPRKTTVEMRPSRIRRDPVRLVERPSQVARTAVRSREQEMWGGVTGVLLMAAALLTLVVGVSIATMLHDDPGADARAGQFGQCYNGGSNCVVDGNTIYVGGDRIEIAGVDAPAIQDARCPKERERGIDTATRLAELLNAGSVTVGGAFRDPSGRWVQKVQVNGEDIDGKMIAMGLARPYYGNQQSWC